MKKEYITVAFLLLGPLLDVTSFLGFPFSIMVRGIFLVSISIYLILTKKKLKILIPLLVFGIVSFLYQYLYLQLGISASISTIFKFLYLPVSILYFKEYLFPMEKSQVLSMILAIYIGTYLASYVLGIGADAYLETDGKSGFKGLFSSINEFSAILVCLLPMVTTYFKNKKKYISVIVFLICSFFCSLLMGTKVLMGGILFTVFYLLWQEREKIFFSRSRNQKIGICSIAVVLLVSGCFLFTKTRTYQNMMVQQSFFQVEKIVSLDFVNRIIYNDRLTFLKDNYNYMKTQSIDKCLLGLDIENHTKLVEIDIFDISFRYGIIGFIVFVSSIVVIIPWRKLNKVDKVSIILLFLVSLTSGHVLLSPAVSIYFAVFCSYKEKNIVW